MPIPADTPTQPRPYVKWYGPCERCQERMDRAYLPDSDWLVCLTCYLEWRELPASHPAKANPPGTNRPTLIELYG